MAVTLDKIKELRNLTGVSIAQCKEALEEAKGDVKESLTVLRKKGVKAAEGKADRETKEGIVAYYLHSNNKVGAMVELLCETDFVAKNQDFQNLGKDIAMQIVATDPMGVNTDDIDEGKIKEEEDIFREQLKNEGKPAEIIEKALMGKVERYKKEKALMSQPFVKNPDITVEELIKEAISKIGENIKIGKFSRFQI